MSGTVSILLYPRTPVGGSRGVSTTATHLYQFFPETCPGGWSIQAIGGVVYIGPEGVTTGSGTAIQTNQVLDVGTTSLKGWYVIASGTFEVRALGRLGGG